MEPKNPFEEKLLSRYKKPEPDPNFVNRLDAQLKQKENESQKSKVSFRWAYVFAPLMALLILFFAVGPNKVIAQLQSWFNFVPGLGVVENPAGIRIVSEPVYQTQDGITVGIKSGLITPDQANFEVEFINLPINSTMKDNPGDPVCNEMPYLVLEDGSKLYADEFQFGVPAEVTEATYVIPCIIMRTRGKTPENWELPLKFIAAPGDLQTYAITFPDPMATIEQAEKQEYTKLTEASNANVLDILEVVQVVEKPNSWLITLSIPVEDHMYDYISHNKLRIVDANGTVVPFSYPSIEESNALFESLVQKYDDSIYSLPAQDVEILKADYAFPLTITDVYDQAIIDYSVKCDVEIFSFDVEGSPQPGDRIEINKNLQLGENQLYIDYAEVAEMAEWGGIGYRFHVNGYDKIFAASFYLLDYPSYFFEGGQVSDPSVLPYQFTSMSVVSTLPSGHIRVGLAQEPKVVLDVLNVRALWTPPTP